MCESGAGVYYVFVTVLSINVPVVYMGRDVMILMWENTFRGPLEARGGP
jgi:hypothetical protein